MALPGFELLHRYVLSVSADLFADSHRAQAVFEAFNGIEIRVYECQGCRTSGRI